MELKGKQKRFLRSQAHHMTPLFQIGKGGMNDSLLVNISEALEKRELIKVSLLQNTEEVAEDVATMIERRVQAKVVQIIGRVLVIYKPSTKEKYQQYSPIVQKMK